MPRTSAQFALLILHFEVTWAYKNQVLPNCAATCLNLYRYKISIDNNYNCNFRYQIRGQFTLLILHFYISWLYFVINYIIQFHSSS